jgi:hypothetical protein
MINATYHLAMARLRAAELERRAAERRGPHEFESALTPQPVTMRLALSADSPVLEQIAETAAGPLPLAPVLIGEVAGKPVAALSLMDGAIVAEQLEATGDVIALLRLRALQLRRSGLRTRS